MVEFAQKYELAGVSSAREMAESGLLMSYGPNYLEMSVLLLTATFTLLER